MKLFTSLRNRAQFGLLVAGLCLLPACDKSIEEQNPAPLAPSGLDENGGNWKTILLTNVSTVPVSAPAATNSASYTAELAQLKTLTSTLR